MPDTNEFFITAARGHCENSIKNTAVGRWLGQSLHRLETLQADYERETAERERLQKRNAELCASIVELGKEIESLKSHMLNIAQRQ